MRFWVSSFLVVAFIVITCHDLASVPRDSYSARVAIAGIDSYRAHVSPHLRGYVTCRFTPTCSAYGRESIRKYGLAVGGYRAIKRIAKCGPWTKYGTVDNP